MVLNGRGQRIYLGSLRENFAEAVFKHSTAPIALRAPGKLVTSAVGEGRMGRTEYEVGRRPYWFQRGCLLLRVTVGAVDWGKEGFLVVCSQKSHVTLSFSLFACLPPSSSFSSFRTAATILYWPTESIWVLLCVCTYAVTPTRSPPRTHTDTRSTRQFPPKRTNYFWRHNLFTPSRAEEWGEKV